MSLKFEQPIDGTLGYVADAVLGDWIFEVKRRTRDIRSLREAFQQIAQVAASDHRRFGILILDEPAVTSDRIRDEWEHFTRILEYDLKQRLGVVGTIGGFGIDWLAGEPPVEFMAGNWRDTVHQIIHREEKVHPKPRTAAFPDVVRTLLVHWIRRHPPVALKQLMAETGYSYPTIATALEKLGSSLVRGSNRSVGLEFFPHDAWVKLLADTENFRFTQRFIASGRPRTPEAMVSRLGELGRKDIAVGGVLGARHWYPGLDLSGTPRLDLTVNFAMPSLREWPVPDSTPPDDFIRRLDPALRPASRDEPANLVVHVLLTPETFFESAGDTVWANEAECLLDLQEARLEAQANEFLNHFKSKS